MVMHVLTDKGVLAKAGIGSLSILAVAWSISLFSSFAPTFPILPQLSYGAPFTFNDVKLFVHSFLGILGFEMLLGEK